MLIDKGNPARLRIGFRRASAWLHLWLGLASGLIVFIVSVTGCIYVFEEEIRGFFYADRLRAEPHGAPPLPVSVLWDRAQAAVGADRPVTSLRAPGAPGENYQFGAFKSDPEAWTYFGERVYHVRAYVDPYDGSVQRVEDAKHEFFNLVLWTHWSLLLSNRVGQPVVGSAVLVFVVLLITGLVLWWPRNRAALRARLRVAWTAKWRRLNWDLHAVPGFYVLPLALVIALTGLVWAFKWFDASVRFAATGGKVPIKEAPTVSDTASAEARAGNRPLDAIFARALGAMPGAREYFVSVPEAGTAAITVIGRFGAHAHYDTRRMRFDRHTGALLKDRSFADLDNGEKLRALNYDLHTGSILGLPGKILAFLASFACASLPVTGLCVWLGKRRRKADSRRSSGPEVPEATPFHAPPVSLAREQL
jgi:uncharacterized iron-regulated membrane protein